MNLIQLHKICIEEKIKIGISKQASRKNVLQDQVYRREREERKRKKFHDNLLPGLFLCIF